MRSDNRAQCSDFLAVAQRFLDDLVIEARLGIDPDEIVAKVEDVKDQIRRAESEALDAQRAALFEVVTYHVGESYVRLYAWAADEAQARELAWKRLKHGQEIASVTKLFDASAGPFATEPSDSGFRL